MKASELNLMSDLAKSGLTGEQIVTVMQFLQNSIVDAEEAIVREYQEKVEAFQAEKEAAVKAAIDGVIAKPPRKRRAKRVEDVTPGEPGEPVKRGRGRPRKAVPTPPPDTANGGAIVDEDGGQVTS